jgi:hypothetical protein
VAWFLEQLVDGDGVRRWIPELDDVGDMHKLGGDRPPDDR